MMFMGVLMMLILGVDVMGMTDAMSDTDKALKEQADLIIKDQNRLDYESKQREQQQRERSKMTYGVRDMESKQFEGQLVTFNVSTIVLKGATALNSFEHRFLTRDFLNSSLDQNQVYELIRNVTNYYIKKGYITTRVYLPKQNFNSGQLVLGVSEGYIEDIRFKQSVSFFERLSLITAFPHMKGNRLNLRHIEQGLDQINRLSSNQAIMKVVPSKDKLGYSTVFIENKTKVARHISVNYDNSKKITVMPRQVSLSQDNVLGINDFWNISYSQDHRDQKNYNNSLSGSFSVPFGYTTFSGSYSRFNYMMLLPSTSTDVVSSGQTENKRFSLKTVLLKGQNTKTTVDGTVSIKHTTSFMGDVINEPGTYRLVVLSVGGNQTWRGPFGIWSMGLHYYRGVSWWNATTQLLGASHSDINFQFKKIIGDLSVYKRVNIFRVPVSFRSTAQGYYSRHRLHSTEQMSVGGRYSVRGFQEESISGDIGAYVRNEVSFPIIQRFNVQLYGGLDAGYARVKGGREQNNGRGEGKLIGAAVGIRRYGRLVTMDLTCAKPLKYSSFVKKTGYEFYFSMSFNWG
jgi:hemolysin activation/secretion protein